MKTEVRKLWVDALRSGEYQQSCGYLKSKGGFCCLGVLVDIYLKQTQPQWQEKLEDLLVVSQINWEPYWKYDDKEEEMEVLYAIPPLHEAYEEEYLPDDEKFREWIGYLSKNDEESLIHYNDTLQFSFEKIANWIEENL